MNTVLLNEEALFGIDNFSKNTTFEGGNMSSTGYMSLRLVQDSPDLNALAAAPITSIKILHDETVIYNSQNLTAHITNINEYLNGDRVDVTVNLVF